MSIFMIGQGDTLPPMVASLVDVNNNPVNLTGATIQFLMQPAAGGAVTLTKPASIQGPATAGQVQVTWSVGDLNQVGIFRTRFVVTFGPGQIQSFPNATYDRVVVVPGITATGPTWPGVEELAGFMGVLVWPEQTKQIQAALLLAGAVDYVRAEAQHRIDYVDQDVKALRGNWSYDIWLPEPPVDLTRPVTIFVDVPGGIGVVIGSDRYKVRQSGLVRRVLAIPPATGRFPLPIFGHWGGDGAEVTVTYSHGYQAIPDDLRTIALAAAARAMANPGELRQEQLHGNTIAFNTNYSGVWLFDSEKRLCRRYRQQARSAA